MQTHIRTEQKKRPAPAMALALFALAAGLFLLLRQPREISPVIAQREEYAVLRGAPAPKGRETVIPRETLLQGALLLVSPRHPLPADYPPPDTRAVRAMVGQYLPAAENTALRREAIYALCDLQADHSLTGKAVFENGAVSAAQQDEMRRDAFRRCQQVYPLREALEKAVAAVPAGGESEHQTGWAVDVHLTETLALSRPDPLTRTETGLWLRDHLWRYGFIRRFGPDDAEAGGCEGIHLRYVGPVHAAAMHTLGLTLEAYWALLRQEGALTLLRDGRPAAYLYCAPCAGDWLLTLPENASFQCSADNTGWAAAAVSAE